MFFCQENQHVHLRLLGEKHIILDVHLVTGTRGIIDSGWLNYSKLTWVCRLVWFHHYIKSYHVWLLANVLFSRKTSDQLGINKLISMLILWHCIKKAGWNINAFKKETNTLRWIDFCTLTIIETHLINAFFIAHKKSQLKWHYLIIWSDNVASCSISYINLVIKSSHHIENEKFPDSAVQSVQCLHHIRWNLLVWSAACDTHWEILLSLQLVLKLPHLTLVSSVLPENIHLYQIHKLHNSSANQH